jgi:hypothetical protein
MGSPPFRASIFAVRGMRRTDDLYGDMLTAPIIVRQREVQDDELRHMLQAAQATGNTVCFFEQFAYRGEPHATLAYGQSLFGLHPVPKTPS